jgi:membrane protein implicated in regulation of membrane protease activity
MARVRGRTGYVITVALTAALGLILTVVGLLAIIGSLASGTGRSWGGAAVALAILAVGALFLSEALRRDRRRRHGLYNQAALASAPSQRIGRRPVMHSPVALGVCTLIMAGIAIAAIVSAVQLHSQAGESAYTQSSGLRRYAIVSTVHNIEHRGRSSTWYTAEISAVLAQPVAGHLATTIWVPYSVSAKRGQLLQVLVDPRQPSYSEVPGAPYVTASQWIIQVVIASVTVGLAALVGWGTLQASRTWRRWRTLSRGIAPGAGADSAVLR